MFKCKYCGREFETKQQLGGHIQHCKLNPNFDEDKYIKITKERSLKASKTIKLNFINNTENIKKERTLICKKCGKEYKLNLSDKEFNNGKYSKFCSRSCANSRGPRSQEIKNKISQSIQKNIETGNFIKRQPKEYHINCKYCGKENIYIGIQNCKNFCSDECKKQYLHENTGGYRENSIKRFKNGNYKGIHCDSSWELAFVCYYKEHNLYVERCKEKREYIWNNEKHIYYPDFITDDGIIEIKGYKVKGYKEKQIYNPDIKVLYYEDIKDILTYVRNKYGNNFWDILYD